MTGRWADLFHWRSAYLQDWIVDPNFPLTWHLRKETSGAGAHYDLGTHIVDMARFLVGEFKSVSAMMTNFHHGTAAAGRRRRHLLCWIGSSTEMGEVTVDDAVVYDRRRSRTVRSGPSKPRRFAPGRKNYQVFEIYGSKGSLVFNLERMNELQLFLRDDPAYAQGFRTIMATEGGEHDYIANWWPPGHIIGYEHEFHHAVVDFMNAIATETGIEPNFYDGVKEIEFLTAATESAETGRRITLAS